MAELTINVVLVIDNRQVSIPVTPTTTAEDVCINLCKQIGIGTVARHLFALRDQSKGLYIIPSHKFDKKNPIYELRIRYKASSIIKLRKVDPKAFDYYFHQARSDVLNSKIPNLIFEKYRRELVGLGVTDMYRVMLEKDIPRETVENDYKKYIPKEVLKRHYFFVKKPIHDTLGKIGKSGHDVWYVKEEYLKQLENMAPEYPMEDYKALFAQHGSICNILVKILPPSTQTKEACIKYNRENKQEELCLIEDLVFISIREDSTVEISRKSGIPLYLKFNSLSIMYSFVSCLDGYYRLTAKSIFNICRNVLTPSLQRLCSMKCHGPVGGEFSYAKLEEKRGKKPGCFIIRESESKYNVYFLDVCTKESSKIKTYKLEKLNDSDFLFNDDLTKYSNLQQLMAAYNDPNGTIFLAECLPPSEHDKSPLLLCQNKHILGDIANEGFEESPLPQSPVCINSKDLQVYKGQKKEGAKGMTVLYKCFWLHSKGKKMEVAMKILQPENKEKYLKEFLELIGQWAFLQSNVIVRLFGVTLSSQLSMVLEYVKLGPLDQYLKNNEKNMKVVDLIEASSNLASALWYLAENGIVHGNIRCRKLLVSHHDENCFLVKLCDPGLHTTYESTEVHWIPVECYSNLEFARKSMSADVWAFGTTLWEIFMYCHPFNFANYSEAKRFYKSGNRLRQPPKCPADIYNVMKECWDVDPHRRKQPQAIIRDINQIMYQVYNSRKIHAYTNLKHYSTKSLESVYSNQTDTTNITYNQEELINLSSLSESEDNLSKCSQLLINGDNDEDSLTCDFVFNLSYSTATTSLDSINSLQTIFELDDDCNVVLQGKIGQGFYGEVYRGTLEYIDDRDNQPRCVAVKKLKSTALSSCQQDFEREISIMKTLKHPNIVEILGIFQEPEISLVMEYVQHGSLQSYLKIYKDTLSTKQLLKFALDIAEGMDYLGNKNIVHRDLAARNILVVDENRVKISDFGLAQVVGTNNYYILKTDRELPIKWYAVESLRDGKFSTKSDVWSYGVTMCEMFSYGEEPNLQIDSGKSEQLDQQILLNALESGIRFPCPKNCPQSVYVQIIYPCWLEDSHARPSFLNLCKEIKELRLQY